MSAGLARLRIGSLFSGVGGLDLAVEGFFGGRTVWHCEFDPEPSKVLAARWPGVPNFGDVTAVDWSTVEPVDILCGGFPCQDLSLAGRRSGMRPGTRSGLWSDFVRAIDALRPKVVVIENVRGLLSGCAESASDGELGSCPRCLDPDGGASHSPNVRALGRVLGDLSALGFDAEWHGLLASDVGAPHGRFRVFVLAYARGVQLGEGWDAVAAEAARGRASAEPRGRADAPVALLPTPSASNANDGEGADTWLARRERVKLTARNGNGMGMPLAIAVQLLPTPTTQPETGNGHARNLGKEVKLLPTPTASEGEHGGPGRMYGDGSPTLGGIAKLLPTPTAPDEGGSGGSTLSNITLTDAVVRTDLGRKPNGRLLPTPRASRGASGTETMLALGAEIDHAGDLQGNVVGEVAWGEYEHAIRLWEAITRTAPAATLPDGKNGSHRLAAVFPEWMMGYSAGWVTDIIDRNPAIKACGNGVLPQQALAALEIMWDRIRRENV